VTSHGPNAWIWAVVAAVILISPWPLLALTRRATPDGYIVAIPVEESGRVALMFGRAPHFAIVDTRTGASHLVANPYRQVEHGAGLKCSRLLIDEHVGVAVAQEIGPEPFQNLTARGIQVYVGHPATVQEAIGQLQRGLLLHARRPTVPTHHGRTLAGLPPVAAAPACPLPGPAPTGAASVPSPAR
jgi:predicted Fe-Mo cluster-binding NifX family protein